MKTSHKLLTIAFALTLCATSVLAGPRHHRGADAGGQGTLVGAILHHWADEIELSDEQRGDLEALMNAERDAMIERGTELREAKRALMEQIQSEVFDEGAIRAAASGVSQLEADAAVAAADLLQRARAILSPDQLAQVEELRAEHQARRHERHERLRERFGRDSN